MQNNQENIKKENNENDQDIKDRLIEEVKKFESSPWVFLIRKSRLTFLVIAALLAFGSLTIKQMPKELYPEVEVPIAMVMTVFPGASPLDVEEQVTKELESELKDLSGVKSMDSSSSLGVSLITMEFEAGEDLDQSIEDLKDKVDKAKSNLPDDAEDPEVVEINISDEPVVEASLTSERFDVADLKQFAENIEDQIKGVPYVSDVVIVGGSDRVVKIDLDRGKLSEFGISVGTVLASLQAFNVNFPLGSIEIDSSRYNIRLEGEFEDAFSVASLPIGQASSGRMVYLEDVASVTEGFAKENSHSRFSTDGKIPTEAVSIQVYKKTGGDITALAEEVKSRIKEGSGRDYPEGVIVEVTNDTSTYIAENINTLLTNGLETVLLILVLLWIFLGWRESLLAGPAIPFSFFIAFIIMALIEESLNFVSLFALVLSLGILVDSAVVVVEGMYNKVSKFGLTGYQAAISTIREYASPLTSGTMTTVAAFFPLLFVTGIFGQFIKSIPRVVIPTLLAGLFVSITIIPAIGTYLIKPVKEKKNGNGEDKIQENFVIRFIKRICGSKNGWFKKVRVFCKSKPRKHRSASRIFNTLSGKYYNTIEKIIKSRTRRRFLLFSSGALFFLTLILPLSGILSMESFTKENSDWFYVNLEMPNGTVLDRTDEVARKIEEELLKEPEIINFSTSVGASFGLEGGSSSSEGSTNRAFIRVNLTDDKEREIPSYDIVSNLRKKLEKEVTEGKVTFIEEESGPPSGSSIEVRVSGQDLLVLEDIAEEVKEEIKKIPTTIDIDTSFDLSAGEFVFVPNKEVLAGKGLNVYQIASELRNGIARNDNVEITRDGDEVKFDLGFEESQLTSIEDIKDLSVVTSSGETLALSELGQINFAPALAKVTRRDNERVVIVTADTDGGNATEINNQLEEILNQKELPSGYRFIFGGEAQELQEVYMDMFLKMILGIILILFILVLQFNSYRQVNIILFSIPLAMIGVFSGMALFGLALDIPAFIGIVSLSGIVVNNAIILIDQINRELRERNEQTQDKNQEDYSENLIEAAQFSGFVRLRPIFLTTITTIFGLLPLSISQPTWRNLGFSIIFGLAFSTMLTLFFVPTLFVSLHGYTARGFVKLITKYSILIVFFGLILFGAVKLFGTLPFGLGYLLALIIAATLSYFFFMFILNKVIKPISVRKRYSVSGI